MGAYFNEHKRIMLLFSFLLLILGGLLYFLLVHPLQSNIEHKKTSVASEEDRVLALKTELANVKAENTDFETALYENRIPAEREVDEYIRTLEKLELSTGSKIEKISFVYDSDFEGASFDEEETEEADDSDEEADNADETDSDLDGSIEELENDSNEADGDDTPHIDEQLMTEKPDDLEELVVKINAVSPDIDAFIQLLETIENAERISLVTHLRFDQATEQDLLFTEDSEEIIVFEAELTTFYQAR